MTVASHARAFPACHRIKVRPKDLRMSAGKRQDGSLETETPAEAQARSMMSSAWCRECDVARACTQKHVDPIYPCFFHNGINVGHRLLIPNTVPRPRDLLRHPGASHMLRLEGRAANHHCDEQKQPKTWLFDVRPPNQLPTETSLQQCQVCPMLTVCKTTHQRVPFTAEAKNVESARDYHLLNLRPPSLIGKGPQ